MMGTSGTGGNTGPPCFQDFASPCDLLTDHTPSHTSMMGSSGTGGNTAPPCSQDFASPCDFSTDHIPSHKRQPCDTARQARFYNPELATIQMSDFLPFATCISDHSSIYTLSHSSISPQSSLHLYSTLNERRWHGRKRHWGSEKGTNKAESRQWIDKPKRQAWSKAGGDGGHSGGKGGVGAGADSTAEGVGDKRPMPDNWGELTRTQRKNWRARHWR